MNVSVRSGQSANVSLTVHRQYHVQVAAVQAQIPSVGMHVSLSIGTSLAETLWVNPRPITRRRLVTLMQTYSKECI